MGYHKERLLTFAGLIGLIVDLVTIAGWLSGQISLALPTVLTAGILFLIIWAVSDAQRNPHDYGMTSRFFKELFERNETRSLALIGLGVVGGLFVGIFPIVVAKQLIWPTGGLSNIEASCLALILVGAGFFGAFYGGYLALGLGASGGDIKTMLKSLTEVEIGGQKLVSLSPEPKLVQGSVQSRHILGKSSLEVSFKVDCQGFTGKAGVSVQYGVIQNGQSLRKTQNEVIQCNAGNVSTYVLTLPVPNSLPITRTVQVTLHRYPEPIQQN